MRSQRSFKQPKWFYAAGVFLLLATPVAITASVERCRLDSSIMDHSRGSNLGNSSDKPLLQCASGVAPCVPDWRRGDTFRWSGRWRDG